MQGGEAVVCDVQEGGEQDVTCLIVDDAEDDAEGECVEALCEVEVNCAEGNGGDEDCGPRIGSSAQHFAFDCFAEE